MRRKVLDILARLMRVHIKVDGISFGRRGINEPADSCQETR